MDLVAERIKIVCEGKWNENQVQVRIDKKYTPEITEEMRQVARNRFLKRKVKNPKLFDGTVMHLDLKHSRIEPNLLLLAMAPIKYSVYDIARKEYVEKFGWKEPPTGMGSNAVVLTSDRKIVMHHRFSWVDHLAKIGVIGGIYNGKPPFDFIREEIKEELVIRREEIKEIFIIGISNRLDERINYEFSFLIEVTLTAKQILERQTVIENKEGEVFFLDQESKSLRQYLEENSGKISSSSFAALVMAGRYWWGSKWSKIKGRV